MLGPEGAALLFPWRVGTPHSYSPIALGVGRVCKKADKFCIYVCLRLGNWAALLWCTGVLCMNVNGCEGVRLCLCWCVSGFVSGERACCALSHQLANLHSFVHSVNIY